MSTHNFLTLFSEGTTHKDTLTLAKELHRARLQLRVFCARCQDGALLIRPILCRVSQRSTANKLASSQRNAFSVFSWMSTWKTSFVVPWHNSYSCPCATFKVSGKKYMHFFFVASCIDSVFLVLLVVLFFLGQHLKYIFHDQILLLLCVCVQVCVCERAALLNHSHLLLVVIIWCG